MNAATNGVTNKVAENLASVRERLLLAASEAGRDPHSILLIGVSKRQPLERVIQAYEAGLRDFGENTVQGLLERIEEFKARGFEARWHFIGRLQRNKLNKLLAYPVIIHTVDSQKMASALNERVKEGGSLEVLIQVNTGAEEQKGGVLPEDAHALAIDIKNLSRLNLRGLMAIPPVNEESSRHFRSLREQLLKIEPDMDSGEFHELSMGMSDDMDDALKEGATMIRIGRAIFGERP